MGLSSILASFHDDASLGGWKMGVLSGDDFDHMTRWWQLKHVLFSSLFGEMIQFDEHIFQMG